MEIHYTPKYGNWLDVAEIELNVMTRQCHSRRIPSIDILRQNLPNGKARGIILCKGKLVFLDYRCESQAKISVPSLNEQSEGRAIPLSDLSI